jgi:nitric oxide reductase subunit B
MSQSLRRGLLVAQGWIQAVVIVVLCGFLILGILAYRTYTDEPPIPSQVVDSTVSFAKISVEFTVAEFVLLKDADRSVGSGSFRSHLKRCPPAERCID